MWMEVKKSSSAALDTTSKMMAVTARHHVEHIANIDILPVCAAYNVRVAMKHIADHEERIGNDSSTALEPLKSLDDAFRARWPRLETCAS